MQTKQEIMDQVVTVLHQTFGLEKERLVPTADLYKDLDIDSIDAIDLLVKMQKMTGKRMQPEAFKSVRSVQDVVDVVFQLVQAV